MRKLILCVSIGALLAGCAMSPPGYMRVGTAPLSVTDLRLAQQEVQVLEAAPSDAKSIGQVTAVRCHQNKFEDEPTQEMIRQDLLVEALGKGATAITDVTVTRRGDALWNCWYLLEAKANAFVLSK